MLDPVDNIEGVIHDLENHETPDVVMIATLIRIKQQIIYLMTIASKQDISAMNDNDIKGS